MRQAHRFNPSRLLAFAFILLLGIFLWSGNVQAGGGEGEGEGEGQIACAPNATVPDGLLLGTMTGVISVHYNQGTGNGIAPTNVAYWRMQFDDVNLNGAYFQFDDTDLGGGSFNDIFSGQPVGSSQFGLEYIQIADTWDGTEFISGMFHYDNVDNQAPNALLTPAGPVSPTTPVAWGITAYLGTGSGPEDGQPINSSLRSSLNSVGTGIQLAVFDGEHLDVSGTMLNDGFVHWYNPSTPNTAIDPAGHLQSFTGGLCLLASDANTEYYLGTVYVYYPAAGEGEGEGEGEVDNTPPTFDSIVAVPSSAPAGQLVTITFDASEVLLGNPMVTVNGNAASFVSVNTLSYEYSYTVSGSDALGAAIIDVMGTDLAGNNGLTSNDTALTIIGEASVPLNFWPGFLAFVLAAGFVLMRRTRGLCEPPE